MVEELSLFAQTNANFNESVIDILSITGEIDLSEADIKGITTDQVTEASNLYFTTTRVDTNANVALNTTHRGLSDNPHAVTALQVGITDVGSTIVISGAERTQITTNQTNITNLTTDLDEFPDALKNLTTAEINQLENIDTKTISNAQWGYLGNLDQDLITTSDATFATLKVNTTMSDDTLEVEGSQHINHTSIISGDHALEIDLDAGGNADCKALDIVYTSGNLMDGKEDSVILVSIDDFNSSGGEIFALSVVAVEGDAEIYGIETAATINPIIQLSGTFSNPDLGEVNTTDKLSEFISDITNTNIFDNDNDYVIIGKSSKFEEIEFILSTTASGAGIKPTFEYSTGLGTWTMFSATDSTNGMKNTGVVVWLDADLMWTTSSGNYLIKITRTQNTLSTTPIVSYIQCAIVVEYGWDKNGDLTINLINTINPSLITTNQTAIALNTTHRGLSDNPHTVTALQVGITDLGSTIVISGAERTDIGLNNTHRGLSDNPHTVTALQVGITDVGSGIIISAAERTLLNSNLIINNWTATTQPNQDDDTTGGYEIGSMWMQTQDKGGGVLINRLHVAEDITDGVAVWSSICKLSTPKNRFINSGSMTASQVFVTKYLGAITTPTTIQTMDAFFKDRVPDSKYIVTTLNDSDIGGGDNYGLEYRFYLYVSNSNAGLINFGVRSDDASDLFINGMFAGSNYSSHSIPASPDITRKIYLEEGYHECLARFYEGAGGAGFILQWDPTGGTTWSYPGDALLYCSEEWLSRTQVLINNTYDLGSSTYKFKDLYLANDISVDGLVDGRDLATDGAKLDLITNTGSGIIISAAERTKLNAIEALADITDATNVTSAGALMRSGGVMDTNVDITWTDTTTPHGIIWKDLNHKIVCDRDSNNMYISEFGNIYLQTGSQITRMTINSSAISTTVNLSVTGNITLTGTADGRDLATDGAKLDLIEAKADVTDATNVAAAGAIVDATFTYNGSKIKQGDQTTSSGSTGGLQLEGTGSNRIGPHFETLVSTDDDPMFQLLSWNHDNIALYFDAYWGDITYYSSDAGSNFAIYKNSDKLQFNYNSGTAKGSSMTWTTAAYFDTSGNFVPGADDSRDLGLTATQWKDIYFSGSVISEQTIRDNIFILWNGASSAFYGFGIRSSTLLYNVPTSAVHSFSINGTELLNIGASAIYPETTATYDLGSTTKTFDNLFLGDSITLPNSTKITTSASGLILQGSTGGSNSWVIVDNNTHFLPYNDDVMDLGQSGNRWDDIWATNSTINTSDKFQKKEIQDTDLGLDFIKKLKPSKYKRLTGTRPHYGLIAQDVKIAMGDNDFAGYIEGDHMVNDKKEKYFGLRYNEFISPMIKSIQELNDLVNDLRAEIEILKNK